MRTDKRFIMCAFVSLISGITPLSSFAAPSAWSDDPTPQQIIQASFDKAAHLLMKKDLSGFSELIDPGALFLGNARISNYSEWKQVLTRELAAMQNLQTSIHLERCIITRKTAVAHIVESDDFTLRAEKGHKFHVDKKITLMLTKTGKGWVSTQVTFNSIILTRDGKAYVSKQYALKLEKRRKGTRQ